MNALLFQTSTLLLPYIFYEGENESHLEAYDTNVDIQLPTESVWIEIWC